MRYAEVVTFSITLDRDGSRPLREQLADQIGAAITSGAIEAGMRLPSTRTLAEYLQVSRGVAAEAFDILHGLGYLAARAGAGTFVQLPARVTQPQATDGARRETTMVDLRPGRVCADAFPLRSWRTAWRHASHQIPFDAELPAKGLPELRRVIAHHLARTRGAIPATHELIVVGGASARLRLVLEALGCRAPQTAIEQPVAPELWCASGAGLVLSTGKLDAIPATCRVAILSPDGDLPFGNVLSGQQRRAVAEWSRHAGSIVEISQEAMFMPSVGQLPRLIDIASGPAIAIGGFEQVLSPSLKLGYALVPRDLTTTVTELLRRRGDQPDYLSQLVAAQLIGDGILIRQRHRLARLHAAKRAITESTLARECPGVIISGESPGTAVLSLPDGIRAAPVALAAREHGLKVHSLDHYYCLGRPRTQALVIGHSHLSDHDLQQGLGFLAMLLMRGIKQSCTG